MNGLRRTLLTLVATLGLLVGITVAAPPARANLGDSHINDVSITPQPAVYGQAVRVIGFVSDDSGSCNEFGDCDTPSGDVFFSLDGCTTFFAQDALSVGPDLDQEFSTFEKTFTNLPVGNPIALCMRYHAPSNIPSLGYWPFNDSQATSNVVINKASTTTTVTSQTPAPSTVGQNVTFSVHVAPTTTIGADAAKPTGTVALSSSAHPTIDFGTTTLDGSGNATITTNKIPVGLTTPLSLTYMGDSNYNGSGIGTTQDVYQVVPTMSVSTSPNPSTFGSSFTATATISSPTATGDVAITVGSVTQNATLANGSASSTFNGIAAGAHDVSVSYDGDANHTFSSAGASVQHVVQKVATTTAVSSAPNPSVFGQPVVVDANIAPAGGTGLVTFRDGAVSIGTYTLTGGDEDDPKLTTSSLAVGSHSLTAAYAGDANHVGSTSSAITHVVNKADTATALTVPNGNVDFGSNGTIKVVVGAIAPGAGTPTGTVTLKDGAVVYATKSLAAGKAQFKVADLLPGSHQLTAVYSGDANFNGSSSTVRTVVVTCRANATSGDVVVSQGSTCVSGAINSLTIQPGATVFVSGARIARTVNASGAARLAICKSTIGGALTLLDSTGPVTIGDGTARCAGNSIAKTATIRGGSGPVLIAGNGGIQEAIVQNNTGGVVIQGNQIRALSCSGNSPAPTNNGRPNQVYQRSGQCAAI